MILEGVRLDDTGKYVFDKKVDLDTDILDLHRNTYGYETFGDIDLTYGYTFNQTASRADIKKFRNCIKHELNNSEIFANEDILDFVEDGILSLDSYKNLDRFRVVVSIKPSDSNNSLFGIMKYVLSDYGYSDLIDIELLKRLCTEVEFDRKKAHEAIKKQRDLEGKKYNKSIDRWLDDIEKMFELQKKKGNIFKIKLYKPIVARYGFTNFVKFKSNEDELIYKELESGTDVLIIDDFFTSGSTIKEIVRYLNMINSNNKITAFTLIKQNT